MTELPFLMRANDIKKHIISIDSRFRQNPTASSSSNYYYQLLTPIKNVLRIRNTSFEFPNNYPFFHSGRSNVTFRVLNLSGAFVTTTVITIPEGNYSAADMVAVINAMFKNNGLSWLSVAFEFITGKYVFSGNLYFGIDTMYGTYERPFDYGLGYYLGFTRNFYKSSKVGATFTLKSDFPASFNGDNYIFLKVNDYECVQHMTDTTDVKALAKIILRDPKSYMAFDDYASEHAKEVVFKAPQNISRLHVQIVDAYGNEIELDGTNHSFSLEVLEILNISLYESVREKTLRY